MDITSKPEDSKCLTNATVYENPKRSNEHAAESAALNVVRRALIQMQESALYSLTDALYENVKQERQLALEYSDRLAEAFERRHAVERQLNKTLLDREELRTALDIAKHELALALKLSNKKKKKKARKR